MGPLLLHTLPPVTCISWRLNSPVRLPGWLVHHATLDVLTGMVMVVADQRSTCSYWDGSIASLPFGYDACSCPSWCENRGSKRLLRTTATLRRLPERPLWITWRRGCSHASGDW